MPELMEIPNRNGFQVFAQNNAYSGHKALEYAGSSYKLGRSTNEATVLLLGLTGAGKSHTINNLFNKEITPVGDGVSCTKEIVEFSVQLQSEESGISNAKLTVLDTPGFGDTESGLGFDAKVIANINKLFRDKAFSPNFIILALNFNDKRVDGKFAPFVKLLQAMRNQLAELVLDTKNPNLIVVLTHLCGALPNLQKDPSAQKRMVQKIIMENLDIPNVPVEVVENCVDDYELERDGDYFILPNKELFPQNIYLGMTNLAKDSDPVGFGILNDAYGRLQKGDFIIQKNTYPIVDVGGIDLDALLRSTTFTTEVGDRMSLIWKQFSANERNQSGQTPTEFAQKLATLGYKNIDNLPKTAKDRVHFFREVAPDSGMESLLQKSFGLVALNWALDVQVGRSFDLTWDMPTSFVVFPPGNQVRSTVGCYLPEHLRASYCPEVKFISHVARSTMEIIDLRLRELMVPGASGNMPGFNYSRRSGYNVVSLGCPNTLNAVYEKRLIKLEMAHNAPFSDQLRTDANVLPGSGRNTWRTFFNVHGTHYITSSYIGGSITFTMTEVNGSSASSTFQARDLHGFLKNVFGASNFRRDNLTIFVQGGNSESASNLASSQTETEFLERLNGWEDSLWENPSALDTSISLGQIADVLGRFNSGLVNTMKGMMMDLYNGFL